MKHSISAVMVLALVEFHLWEEVNEGWFAQYGMERDMVGQVPLEDMTEEEAGEGGY